MKNIDVNPKKARVKGNILADWNTMVSKSKWEDYHVKREKINNVTWNKHELSAIRLNPMMIPVTMQIYADEQGIEPGQHTYVYVRLEYDDEGRGTLLAGQTVHLYEGTTLIATGVSDSDGLATFEYSSEISGTHLLTARSLYGNGFDAAEIDYSIFVVYYTHMTLEPRTVFVGFGEIQELTATLYDQNNQRVPDKPIDFYEGVRPLGTVTTDKNGKAVMRYIESNNKGQPTEIILDPGDIILRQDTPCRIAGQLLANGDTPLANKHVKLFVDNSPYGRAEVVTDSTGIFVFNYTPEFEDTRHYYIVFMSEIKNTTNNEYVEYAPCMYDLGELELHKALTTVEGVNASAIKGQDAGWQCIVPKDYDGDIYVYATDANGNLLSNDGNSILSSTKLFKDDVTSATYDSNNVIITWHGWDDNRTYAQSYQNKVGQFYIRYRLYNDSKYENTYSTVKHINIRQKAVVTTNNATRRKLDDKEVGITGTCKDELGNNYNGTLDVLINNTVQDTVECTNGVFSYSLMPVNRKYSEHKVTSVEVKFVFADSGYWASLNDSATTNVINIKNNQSGYYWQQDMLFTTTGNTLPSALTRYNLEDLYLVMPQDQDFSKLEYAIEKLSNNRDTMTIHAVVPCYTDDSHYTSAGRLDLSTRLNNLKTHISQLLTMDIDGICLQDLRGKTENTYNVTDVTSALNTLINHINNNNTKNNLMISAIVDADTENMATHGQNYQTFTEKCDYIMPLLDSTGKTGDTAPTFPHDSKDIDYYQDCLESIYNLSGNDNVYPLVYMGNERVTQSAGFPNERRKYIIRGIWNYGARQHHVQKSIIQAQTYNGRIQGFAHDLNTSYLLDENDDTNMISTVATLKGVIETGEVYITGNPLRLTLRTGYGGKAGYDKPTIALALDGISLTRKSDGATEFQLNTVTNAEIDLNQFNLPVSTGNRVLELTIGESKSMRIQEYRGQWEYRFE